MTTWCRAVLAIAVIAACAYVRADVQVVPFRLEESRSAVLTEDKIGHSPDSLKVVLSLKGPEAEAAAKYGNLKLEEAVDDKGASLVPPKDTFHDPGKFREYSNAFFRKSDLSNKRPAADPQVEITLAKSQRAATRIAHLRGSFQLSSQGTIKTIELTGLDQPGERKLDIPAGAGIQVTATVKAGDKMSIGIQITGDESALESIEVMDASGKKVSGGMSSWSFNGGPEHKSIDVMRPLDGTMKLVAKVGMDRNMTTVPFDLKDVTLP